MPPEVEALLESLWPYLLGAGLAALLLLLLLWLWAILRSRRQASDSYEREQRAIAAFRQHLAGGVTYHQGRARRSPPPPEGTTRRRRVAAREEERRG
jgi:hypothetical protein